MHGVISNFFPQFFSRSIRFVCEKRKIRSLFVIFKILNLFGKIFLTYLNVKINGMMYYHKLLSKHCNRLVDHFVFLLAILPYRQSLVTFSLL